MWIENCTLLKMWHPNCDSSNNMPFNQNGSAMLISKSMKKLVATHSKCKHFNFHLLMLNFYQIFCNLNLPQCSQKETSKCIKNATEILHQKLSIDTAANCVLWRWSKFLKQQQVGLSIQILQAGLWAMVPVVDACSIIWPA